MKIKYFSVRNIIQLLFTFIVLTIGYRFYGFVRYCETAGETSFFNRPPGVEAFLPISSLMSLKYFVLTGEINPVHPSGLIIFVAIIVISFLFKKAFCSWMCPIGFLSEFLWKVKRYVFKKDLKMPKLLDSLLRSLKYIVLGFFLWVILVSMDVILLKTFIFSPYNRVADVKMLIFFSNISTVSIVVIAVLVLLSFVFTHFWCRYLCPYGGLLGLISMISPFKITRNIETCIDCKKCSKACPANITVHSSYKVHTDECMACLECVEACPVEHTLEFKSKWYNKSLSGYRLASVILITYLSFVGFGKITGHWDSSIPLDEYIMRIQDIDNPVYDHNRGTTGVSDIYITK